ncbi:chloride channel protein [Streptococcus thermophilus]|uniref:chloride channel protein n=1 Tax=Streptococcus thermophilus TaxID=1308 RepID=UPI003C12FE20
MGNGQVLAQWIFSGNSSAYLLVILIIKCLLVCLLLRSGAYGGTLTPSFAIGVGTGYLITVLLGNFGFSHSLSLGMLLGATVFLGTMLDPPLTPPNRNSLGCWFYRYRRSYRIPTYTSKYPIKDDKQ